MNIAVFSSHEGSDLQAIMDACRSGAVNARVCCVISNNRDSHALERARKCAVPAYHFSARVIEDPTELETAILNTLIENRTDIIFLAGYLKKLGSCILSHFQDRVFNIHPSLLPKYGGKGMYGIHVHTAVVQAGEQETGITVHRVNAEYDDGQIIAQQRVPVLPDDTPECLAARVLTAEHKFLVDTLGVIIDEMKRHGRMV